MDIYVQKYGGSSVSTTGKIKDIARRIAAQAGENRGMVIVVSAMGNTTDKLIDLAHEVSDRPNDREMDMLVSTGEQVSISLLAMALDFLGHPVISLTGPQVGIKTTGTYKKAKIVEVNSERILKELHEGKIVIVAGFQGITENQDITTLGRGGSDTTAVALAAALRAEKCDICTDIDGVYTADPRIVDGARKLKEISYGEMLEMATQGAKVLHPRSVELAHTYDIPLEVRSSTDETRGTIVKGVESMEDVLRVSGVTHDKNICEVAIQGVPDVPGVAYRLFSRLDAYNIGVDMIIQSIRREKVNDISFTVNKDDLEKAVEVMEQLSDELGAQGVTYDKEVAKISVVGAGLVNKSQTAGTMFQALAEEDINIRMISSSEIKISCLIDEENAEKAVRIIHKKFSLNGIGIVESGENIQGENVQ